MRETLVTGLAPVLPPESRVVILGSMPGERSLQAGQYYAHPRNLFWPLMQRLICVEPAWPYEQRLAALRAAGIGLWDVLQQCERQGSLDSSIIGSTEVANDLSTLPDRCPGIRALCFNGRKAEQAFRRYALPKLPGSLVGRLALVSLPSSSPANAALSLPAKVEAWQVIRQYLR